MNLKTSSNADVQKISADVWASFWKKYMNLSNASPDKEKHFTDEKWDDIIKTFGEVAEKWNCRFASKLLLAYLEELEARNRGAYLHPNDEKVYR